MSVKKPLFFLLIGVMLAGSGCSYTNRGPKMIALTISPSDAYVIINGTEYRNPSPQFVEVTTSRTLLITAYKPGYRENNYVVDNQLSSVGTIDALGSIFLFPFFGLFSEGAWELKETNIRLELEPLPEVDTAVSVKNAEPAVAKSEPVAQPETAPAAVPDNATAKPAEPQQPVVQPKNEIQPPVLKVPEITPPADSGAKAGTDGATPAA